MIAMAVGTQHDQVALPFEADALVRAVVHLESVGLATQITNMAGLLERERPDTLPVRGLQVLAVRETPQGRDGLFQRLIGFLQRHTRSS